MEPDHRAEARERQVRALPRVLRRKRGRGRAVDEAGEDGDGVGVTRRSMKRAAASVRWVVLSFLSLRRRCLRQSMRPTRDSTFPTPMIYALEFYCGLAKTPAGRTIDRTRSAPSRGFVRPMEQSDDPHGGCFRALSAPRARSHRDKSARVFPFAINARKHPLLAPSGARRLHSRRCNRVVVLLTTTKTQTKGLKQRRDEHKEFTNEELHE